MPKRAAPAAKAKKTQKKAPATPALTPYPDKLAKAESDKRQPKTYPRLPGSWELMRQALELIRMRTSVFIGITVVYGFLVFVLVQTLSFGATVGQIRSQFSPGTNIIASGLGVFSTMLSSFSAGQGATGGIYQFLLLIIGSLALIWAFRRALAGDELITIREAYYRSMYPFIPFILILLVIGLELLPLIIGSTIYNLMVTQGIAIGFAEDALFGLIFAFLALLTLYLISSTFLALYIVTDPDAMPMESMRQAKALVRGRRLTVFVKVIFLAVALLLAAVLIILPVIIVVPALAQLLYFIISILALLVTHAYMYTLYMELNKSVTEEA